MTKLQVRQIFHLFLIILDDSRMSEHMHFFLFFDQFSLHDRKTAYGFETSFIIQVILLFFDIISFISSVNKPSSGVLLYFYFEKLQRLDLCKV